MGNLWWGSTEVTYVFFKPIVSPVLQTYLLLLMTPDKQVQYQNIGPQLGYCL
jgi:hypothetical protein